jgi:transposase
VPLDNGLVERLHVRTALTRKNFLFAGADSGAERAAIAFTILGSCVSPVSIRSSTPPTCCRAYAADPLVPVPSLLPSRWAAARAAATAA